MARLLTRIAGSCYLLLALLNIYRRGVFSLGWIAWALLGAGALTMVYTPVEKDGKMTSEIVMSRRNQTSLAIMIPGGLLLVYLMFYHR